MYDNCHWVAAACIDGDVVLTNSLGDAMSPLVSTQLKQLYAHLVTADGGLEVRIVKCAQQPNGSDCGVFAEPLLFEWALASVQTDLEVKFDVSKMRAHLISCLELQEVHAFPRWRQQGARNAVK